MSNTSLNAFQKSVLDFVKKYLMIKSDIVLVNKTNSFDATNKSQTMAQVSLPIGGVYHIAINFNDTKFGFVRRVAHECVHVKQMESGRLIIRDRDEIVFDGELTTLADYQTKYHTDVPKFEEEAFDMEKIVANAYWKKFS